MLKQALRLMSIAKNTQPQWTPPQRVPDAPLRIYNSLTRTKTEFTPLVPHQISWYSCGPTVYTHSHMGHARNYVSTDINRRILQDYFGYDINFVQNVTDIDDKIIIAARHEYLFEHYVVLQHSEVDEGLVQLAEKALAEYAAQNLPAAAAAAVADADADADGALDDLAADAQLTAANPKLPMHVRACRDARRALAAARGGVATPAEFLASVKDVCMPHLDALHGAEVNDPAVFRKLPRHWEHKFNEDMARLNVLPPTVTTRVLEYVPDIVRYVERIIANGYAYAAGGLVYFDTVKFDALHHLYAKIQPWNKGDMLLINDGEGSLSVGGAKRNAADFALWKLLKPGEPRWELPWGAGRPGWHIECLVMALDVLGATMDIHLGGVDLCFPHHDNELAQLEAYYDNQQWVNYFMHNGHLHIQGQKMSKLLKNFITIEEALERFSLRQLRLTFAMNAWEKTIDFKDSFIKEVKAYEATVSKFFTVVRALKADYEYQVGRTFVSKRVGDAEKRLYAQLRHAQAEVHRALCDNLNTPQALRSIQELIANANAYIQAGDVRIEPLVAIGGWITKMLAVFGFETAELGWKEGSGSGSGSGSAEEVAMLFVKALSEFRDTVRLLAIGHDAAPILAASDRVRQQLIDMGVLLDDRPNGLPALVKFLNPQEQAALVAQQREREQAALDRQRKKEQQAAANAERERQRASRMKVSPLDMFKELLLYSEWDEQGLPVRDAKGEEVTKSMRKKLAKQQQQQQKLHEEYLRGQ